MFPYATGFVPPCPAVYVRIVDNRRNVPLPRFLALIDSGADTSCLPLWVVEQTADLDYELGLVEGYDGRKRTEKFVRILSATVDFSDETGTVFVTGKYENLRLLVISVGLIGRDVLNLHSCQLDGPGLVCRIGDKA
jgi:hypothetical protein